ncbi:MAG: YlbF family regulator [Verrucomicrobiales bacterium]
MEVLSPNSAILERTRELCSLILQSDEYQENAAKVETFFKDDEAQTAYREFGQLGEELQQKQQSGGLGQPDIDLYESQLEDLKKNPVVADFMEAEATLNGIVQQIARQVGKTLELGRLPTPEDLEEGGCCSSGGCGCD